MKILPTSNYQAQNNSYKNTNVNRPQVLFGLKNSSLEKLECYSINEVKNMLEMVIQQKFYLQERAINNFDIGVRYFVGFLGSPVLKYSPGTNNTSSFIKIQKPGYYNVLLHSRYQKLSEIDGLKELKGVETTRELKELGELRKLYVEATRTLDELIEKKKPKQI